MTDKTLTADERRELFGESFDDHQAEAEQRWGETEQWQQSAARTKRYTKADWARLKSEQNQIFARQVATRRGGADATSTEAMDAVEEHRLFIDRWFYDCPRAFHANLGDMYVADPRFIASMGGGDDAGYAEWLRDAMRANASR